MNKLLICLGIIISSISFSQNVRIEGNLIFSDSTENLGQFTIFSLPDSTLRKGGYIDSSYFSTEFNTKKTTDFYIKIKAYGYKDTLISFTADDTLISLGTIDLNNNRSLGEVEVTYRKPMFVRTMDGLKVNVEGTTLQTLNNLFDILKASPKLISPDDESIEIIGKGVPLILIDRQAIITNDELKAIPADMVGSIEIITNPSSRYKAQGGNNGVIEVYTKNFHLEGYNMNISADGGLSTQLKPTSRLGMGFNLKRNKFSMNGYLGANYNSSNSFANSDGVATDGSGRSLTSSEEGDSWNTWQYYSLKGAYRMSKNHTLSFGVKGHGSFGGYTDHANESYSTNDSLQTLSDVSSTANTTWLNNSAFLNYVWETDTNHSALEVNLNLVAKTSNGDSESATIFENIPDSVSRSFNISNDNKDRPRIGELKINYDHVFDTTGWELSVGGYYSKLFNGQIYNQYNLIDDNWEADPLYSNSYDYSEDIAAAYAEISKKWDKFGFRLGVRGEYAKLDGYSNSLGQQFIDSSYILAFPTASILIEPNNVLGITLAYSSGIDRPQFSNYDPFVRIKDSLNVEIGNPYLRPSIEHTFSVDFDIMYAYNISVSYSRYNDPTSDLYFIDDNSFQITSTPWNAELEQDLSLSISLPFMGTKIQGWNSAWISYGKFTFTDDFDREPFFNITYGVFSYLSFILPKDFSIMNRLHIIKWGDANMVSNARINWGLRFSKKMMDNNFQIYFDVNNIIPPKNNFQLYSGVFDYNYESRNQFTSFKLGLYYKFGRLKRADNIKESESGQSGRI